MQDIHTLGGVGGGGGGRIFSGGVDRRLQAQNLPSHPPLKCPRCDSQNTKFCYYNNYNLSQPRHFCKNCRRYWTKGGVLRNVPVGGGCRKSKRSSKSKPSSGNSSSNSLAATTTDSRKNDESENNSHSSSESSSLTASTTAATKPVVAAGAGTGTASSANAGLLLSQHRGENDVLDHFQPLIEHQESVSVTQMIPIPNMVSSCNDPGVLGLNPEGGNEPEKAMIDQQHEVQVDPTALDWGNVGVLGDADVTNTPVVNVGGGEENGLFDFSGVDESYWNHAPWVEDNDQAFNFLPQFQVLDFNLEKK